MLAFGVAVVTASRISEFSAFFAGLFFEAKYHTGRDSGRPALGLQIQDFSEAHFVTNNVWQKVPSDFSSQMAI